MSLDMRLKISAVQEGYFSRTLSDMLKAEREMEFKVIPTRIRFASERFSSRSLAFMVLLRRRISLAYST